MGAPLAPAAVVTSPPAEDSTALTLNTGYMSHYHFYGVELGRNVPWVSVEYAYDGLPMPIALEVWYARPSSGLLDHELDLILKSGGHIAGFDTEVALAGYFYPSKAIDDSLELSLSLERALGPVDWNTSAAYDFIIEGWYFETGLGKEIEITDKAGINFLGGIGYQMDYNSRGGNWNHTYVTAELPIQLHKNITIEPYIGWLSSLKAIESFQDDILHGGISLTISY
jgi:hypothetical protein